MVLLVVDKVQLAQAFLGETPLAVALYPTQISYKEWPATQPGEKGVRPRCYFLPTEPQTARSKALTAVLLKTQVF